MSAGRGVSNWAHLIPRYMTDIIELDKLQGRVVRVGAVVPASGCYGAAYLSEVMVLPLSPSHSSVMPSVV